jgi:hypothetical protein
MKKLLLSILLMLVYFIPAEAQQVRMFQYSTDASGGCPYMYLAQNITDGKFFYCKKSSWSSDFVLGDITADSLTIDGFIQINGSTTTSGDSSLYIALGDVKVVSGSVSVPVTEKVTFDGDPTGATGEYIYSPTGNEVATIVGGVSRIIHGTTETSINDGLNDLNFNVKGNTLGNVLFIDGGIENVLIHDLTNANNTQGLTVNQLAADDQAFTLKSSDVNTSFTTAPITGSVETDDFYVLRKGHGTLGGLMLQVIGTSAFDQPFTVEAYGGNQSTTKSSSGIGMYNWTAVGNSGSNGLANIDADGNIWAIRARIGGSVQTLSLLDEDGDKYIKGSFIPFDDNQAYHTLGLSNQRWSTIHAAEISNNDSAAVTITGGYVLTGPANVGSAGSLTIASGAVAITKTYHTLVVEGGAGSGADSLATATGGVEGDILILKTTTSGANDQVTISDGTGSNTFILAGADFVMNHVDDRLELIHNGTEWVETSRSGNS